MAADHGLSIKDDERYGALREEGYSREDAARILRRSRRPVEADPNRRGVDEDEL